MFDGMMTELYNYIVSFQVEIDFFLQKFPFWMDDILIEGVQFYPRRQEAPAAVIYFFYVLELEKPIVTLCVFTPVWLSANLSPERFLLRSERSGETLV